jgi:hypothetical protein
MFGRTEEIGIGKNLSRLCKLMPQLRAIGRQVMKPSEDEETGQAAVLWGSIHRSNGRGMHLLLARFVHGRHYRLDAVS